MFKENKSEDSNNAVSEGILATGSKKLKSLRDVFPTGFSADILNTARILQFNTVNLLSQSSLPCFPLQDDTVFM